MRSGMDRLLARVVEIFGASQPHHAYVFANRRGTRLKVLVCDGFGIWLAVRRLHQGSVHWPRLGETQIELCAEQARALVLGLPRSEGLRLGKGGVRPVEFRGCQ